MLNKKILFILSFFILLSSEFTQAQENLTWKDFGDVRFYREFKAEYFRNFLVPVFGDHIKSLEGKEVSITGYFLDFSGEEEFLLVSKNPMASCFFCGGAGPQTIIEVHFKSKTSFKTDDIIRATGTLRLNKDDVDHCNYILENATGEY